VARALRTIDTSVRIGVFLLAARSTLGDGDVQTRDRHAARSVLRPVFAATSTVTWPTPLPPGPTATHVSRSTVQPQPDPAVTATCALPPVAVNDSELGLTLYEQGGGAIVPVRKLATGAAVLPSACALSLSIIRETTAAGDGRRGGVTVKGQRQNQTPGFATLTSSTS
jgi:hypothetical protein